MLADGQSEIIIGKALKHYDIDRESVVIMTKLYYPVLVGTSHRPQPAHNTGKLVNRMGLSRKHIFTAVEASLERLGTTYIDVLQLHRLDRDTSPEEVMCALHDLVKMGKIHYLGGSSMYCWEFARLQYTAKLNHWTTFASMQNLWNLLYREEEREMIPFCEAEGIGLIPWSPLARGLLARPWNSAATDRAAADVKAKSWFVGNQDQETVGVVQKIAGRKNVGMGSVALAWLLAKDACPIVGLNSEERIEAVLEALSVSLDQDEMKALEELYHPLSVQAH